jgi:hypothetical protein
VRELRRVRRAGSTSLKEQVPVQESTEVRSAIQRITLEHRQDQPLRAVDLMATLQFLPRSN